MKQFTLKRMALCAFSLLVAFGASAATETYTFKGIATDGTTGLVSTEKSYGEIVSVAGSNYTTGNFVYFYSYDGTIKFNNRFAVSDDKKIKFRANGDWSGIANEGKVQTYLSILNLKNGDKVTIKMKSGSAALNFDNKPSVNEDINAGTAVTSDYEYTIQTASASVPLNFVTTSGSDAYIYSIKIETADIPNNGTVAAQDRVWDLPTVGGSHTVSPVKLTWGGKSGETWSKWDCSSVVPASWGGYFTNGARIAAPTDDSGNRCNTAGKIPEKGGFIKVQSGKDGVLALYGQFQYDIYISDANGYLFEKVASGLTSGWQIVKIALKADVEYWIWNDANNAYFCGYRFYRNGVTIADGLAYTTFGNYTTSNYAVPSGVKAYAATYTSGASTVTLKEVTAINAGQGVLLEGSAATYDLTVADADATNYEGNLLQATATDVALQSDGSYTYYVYGRGTKGEGFYKVSSSKTLTVAAGKAYLKVPVSASAPSFLDFDFEDNNTTGINKVQDSGLKVQGSDTYYNLAGQRVAQPTKGLYIVNGKKVIIK
ncbi:MAG: hypothetical protein IJ614_06900 [Prevotella sp.]|nr:hypothetical protein [Prevotella sp.]